MANRQSDFVSQYRRKITDALIVIGELQALHAEATLMQYPEQMDAEKAIEGENADIDIKKLTEAMGAASSILADISREEFTSLYRIRL